MLSMEISRQKGPPMSYKPPFMACYGHFQELTDFTDELERYKKNTSTQNVCDNNVQSIYLESDMDVDAMFMEHNN